MTFEEWITAFGVLGPSDHAEEITEQLLFEEAFKVARWQEQVDSGRWNETMQVIYKHTETERYLAVNWEQGLTEYQDVEPEVSVYEVFPRQVMTMIYTTTPER